MPNLAKELRAEERARRRSLDEAGKLQWPGELRDAFAWTTDARVRSKDEMRKIRLEYVERRGAWYQKSETNADQPPQRDHSHNLIAQFTLIGGVFAGLLECLLACFLSTQFFELPLWVAILLGFGITIFFAALVMACIAALVLARYPDKSRATSRPLIWILSITLPLALLLMTLFFLIRGLQTPFLISLFGWDTAFLAVDLPIVAGVLLTLRGLFNWSGEYEDTYHRLLTASARVEDLRIYCDRELKEIDKAPSAQATSHATDQPGDVNGAPSSPLGMQDGPVTNGKAILPVLLAVFLGATLYAHDARADSPPRIEAELWFDDTISVDAVDREQATGALLSVLPSLAESRRIDRWSFYGFGDNPWRQAPFFQADVPRWLESRCVAGQTIFKQEGKRLFDECLASYDRKFGQFKAASSGFYRHIGVELSAHVSQPAKCTGIGDLLKRISEYSAARYTVVVSDGIETCRSIGLPPVPAPAGGRRVVFVLTESVSAAKHPVGVTQGDLFEQRKIALLQSAPWLTVIAPAMIDEHLFEPLHASLDFSSSDSQQASVPAP